MSAQPEYSSSFAPAAPDAVAGSLIEDLFRSVNARILELDRAWERALPPEYDLICECRDAGCFAVVRIAPGIHARVAAEPEHYLVVPGHEQLLLDDVVERAERYVVVRKRRRD